MNLGEKLHQLATKVEILEEQKWDFNELEFDFKMATAEGKYLRHFIESIGLDPDEDYSVGQMIEFQQALAKAKV